MKLRFFARDRKSSAPIRQGVSVVVEGVIVKTG
jgi:hypothetical protein